MPIEENVVLDDEAFKPSRVNPEIFQKMNPRDDTSVTALHAGVKPFTPALDFP
jgi:hypothetical protein